MTARPDNHGEALNRRNLFLTSSAFAAAVAIPSDVPRAQVDPTNAEVLRVVIQSLAAMPVGPLPAGGGINEILRAGQLNELGTRFDVEDLGLAYLYSGLAVLSRDTFNYLQTNPREDAQQFLEFVNEVYAAEKPRYGDGSFPYYSGQAGANELPATFGNITEIGYADISKLSGPDLGEPDIIHEWTFKPGKRIFLRISDKCRETICEEGGPYKAFQRGDRLLGQADLPFKIAQSVAIAVFAPAAFWYPLAAYVGFLILKTGLKTYCEV